MAENRNRHHKLVPCNTPECVQIQNKRKAEHRATVGPAEKERPEPSEQSQRGGHVFIPDSIDTASGLAETPAGDEDVQAEPDPIIAKDDHSEESIKKRLALKKELELGKVRRSPSLEQPIVTALINPANPSALYGYDENGDAIQRPKEDSARHRDLLSRDTFRNVSLRCGKHSDQPGNDCPKCREDADHQRARDRAAVPTPERPRSYGGAAGRPVRTHGEKPIPVVPSSGSDIVKQIERPFGFDIKHGNKAPRATRAPREYSYRKIFDLKRSQIVGWLSDLHIRYINAPTVVTVSRKQLVTQEADNTEFEKWRATKITELKGQLAEYEKELADLRANWKSNGHTNKTNIAMRNRFVKSIGGLRDEITQTKRAKPAESEPKQIEVDIPGTEHEELIFTGQQLDETWRSDYLNSYDVDGFPLNPQVGDEDFRVFENAVISQAYAKKVFSIDPDLLKMLRRRHPGLLDPGKDEVLDHGEHETRAEYESHSESDAHASGLRFRGKGIKVTGNKSYGKALETFDGVFQVNRGPGSGGDGGHPGAPDFDVSDDTNE